MFDLYSYTLHYSNGKDLGELPGLLVQAAPSKTTRNRRRDIFFALLTIKGSKAIPADKTKEFLQKAAKIYYEAEGSLTSGLKNAARFLHDTLVEWYKQEGGIPNDYQGLLNLAVVHQDVVFLVHSGPTHSVVFRKSGVEIISEPQEEDQHWFGVGDVPYLRYYQVGLDTGETIVYSPRLPAGWTPQTLAGLPSGSGREALRRRLLIQSEGNTSAAIFQVQKGNGNIHPLLYRPAGTQAPSGGDDSSSPVPSMADKSSPVVSDKSTALRESSTPVILGATSTPAATGESSSQFGKSSPMWRQEAARVGLGVEGFLKRMGRGVQTFLVRLLPEQKDTLPKLTTATMLFIAIAVPVVIIAIAATVYVRSGRTNIQAAYIQKAQEIAQQAVSQQDLSAQRTAWEEVILWLDKADKYRITDESIDLRQQAQGTLDNMDAIRRLTFQPALAIQMDARVNIVKLLASSSEDLYALDSDGWVHHLVKTGTEYEIDSKFTCGSGSVGMIIIGPLVDIVSLPPNNPHRAAIMGIDASGNLLYCSPNKGSEAVSLVPPPNLWGELRAVALSGDGLDVLDGKNNIVWRYEDLDLDFQGQPRDFFDNERPTDLSSVIDLEASDEFLFILRADGQMAVCEFRTGMTYTRCNDPTAYHMIIAGKTDVGVTIPPAQFIQMQITQPPEPSLFILDASGPAVYHFSHKLNMKLQYRPDLQDRWLPDRTVSAFVVTPARNLVLAFGNRLYIAPLP